LRGRAAAFRPAPHGRDRHTERQPTPRHGSPDPAEPENAEPQLPEFAHRDRAVGEILFGPPALALRRDHAVEAAREIGDRGDDPVGIGSACTRPSW